MLSQDEYEHMVDLRVMDAWYVMEEAEHKFNEAKTAYETALRQKEMYVQWVKGVDKK